MCLLAYASACNGERRHDEVQLHAPHHAAAPGRVEASCCKPRSFDSMGPDASALLSRYPTFDRASWSKLRDATPLTLSDEDLRRLRGLNEAVSTLEVEQIYLPLSRLLSLHCAPRRELHRASQLFLWCGDREGAVHHRSGRQRRAGKEHDCAHSAGAAVTLAGASTRRPVTTDGFSIPTPCSMRAAS